MATDNSQALDHLFAANMASRTPSQGPSREATQDMPSLSLDAHITGSAPRVPRAVMDAPICRREDCWQHIQRAASCKGHGIAAMICCYRDGDVFEYRTTLRIGQDGDRPDIYESYSPILVESSAAQGRIHHQKKEAQGQSEAQFRRKSHFRTP
ncbi:hypothetical protein CDD80_4214 [Ophiocordyceps camponoti-rufipedis]|uniref:Uncharacterized protein n=1 Tax=Ophiocordyceps camponoti-rufipedis TaxID=2004952 RepID=A0A2C5Z103_9HYPO|nr:hypothetical protein CDD80_4214 [Ophiocordyceps camponoti-rufipedis]